jgi:hypothetical protein
MLVGEEEGGGGLGGNPGGGVRELLGVWLGRGDRGLGVGEEVGEEGLRIRR